MSLFGRRKPEQNPVGVFEAAQQAFTRDFKEWLARIEDAQERSGSAQLSGEILAIAGAVPLYDRTGLNTTQLVYIRSYARSYAENMLRHRRDAAVVAAADASGPTEAARLDPLQGVEASKISPPAASSSGFAATSRGRAIPGSPAVPCPASCPRRVPGTRPCRRAAGRRPWFQGHPSGS